MKPPTAPGEVNIVTVGQVGWGMTKELLKTVLQILIPLHSWLGDDPFVRRVPYNVHVLSSLGTSARIF